MKVQTRNSANCWSLKNRSQIRSRRCVRGDGHYSRIHSRRTAIFARSRRIANLIALRFRTIYCSHFKRTLPDNKSARRVWKPSLKCCIRGNGIRLSTMAKYGPGGYGATRPQTQMTVHRKHRRNAGQEQGESCKTKWDSYGVSSVIVNFYVVLSVQLSQFVLTALFSKTCEKKKVSSSWNQLRNREIESKNKGFN